VGDLQARIQQEVNNEQVAVTGFLGNRAEVSTPLTSDVPCESWQSQGVRAADLLWENELAIEQFYAPSRAGSDTTRAADLLKWLSSLTKTLDSLVKPPCDRR
jgi:hypothetical protein